MAERCDCVKIASGNFFLRAQPASADGVDAKNLKEYLEAPFVHAVGGSWLCPKKEIAAGNFDAVTALCREASEIVREVRG